MGKPVTNIFETIAADDSVKQMLLINSEGFLCCWFSDKNVFF
jgi:hypothetical protein